MGNAASPARVLVEVSTLSGLYHAHVVRYFQAWREEDQSWGGLWSQTSSDPFSSRALHTTVSASGGHTAGAGHRCNTSSLPHAHTPAFTLKGTDSMLHDGNWNARKGRLDTVAETSVDRGASPPSESTVALASALPSSTVSTSVLESSLPEVFTLSPRPKLFFQMQHVDRSDNLLQSPGAQSSQHESRPDLDSERPSESSSCATRSNPAYDDVTNSAFTFGRSTQVQESDFGTSGGARLQCHEVRSKLAVLACGLLKTLDHRSSTTKDTCTKYTCIPAQSVLTMHAAET